MKISLRLKLGVIFSLFLLLNIAAFGVMQLFLAEQKPDAVNINLAGKQRMLSQKMAKESMLIIYSEDTEEIRNTLMDTAALFDRTLRGFLSGDQELGLDPTVKEEIIIELNKGKDLWKPFYQQIEVVAGNAGRQEKLEAFSYIRENNLNLLQQMNKVTLQYEQDSKLKQQKLVYTQLVLVFLNLVLVAMAWLLTDKRIVAPIAFLARQNRSLADGDLTVEVSGIGEGDEVGILYSSCSVMIERLRTLVGAVQHDSHRIAQSSHQLNQSADTTCTGTERVVLTSQEVTANIESEISQIDAIQNIIADLTIQVGGAFQDAQGLNQAAWEARDKAVGGYEILQDVLTKMAFVGARMNEAALKIRELGEDSEQITEIVSTISSIAEQTNLLALNAAIEAARAGDKGRGFAVVADEVRKLAESASNATVEIKTIIVKNQKNTQEVIAAIEAGNNQFVIAHKTINTAGESFTKLLTTSEEVDARANKVTQTIQKVIEGNELVVSNVQDIQQVVWGLGEAIKQVAAASEETLASMSHIRLSAQGLSELADDLAEKAGEFNT
ncbi:methyl-accepting chemotaxis protein [Desulfitobacterium chlororespirans]|uniref:Methyl-accepting chemotaxis protein n=1 Tax=Desulfitobacterium chlororespirans DSM 11544 TaxID=1121395 RepID=A0A1M7T2N7_9FIRM|nr:methyl-accepting chemotaxis protein [Desulfitobacterium chlororespirans]SHN64934.1 Methyl-accepting chemotaxis protein [Desulfitobacterium chlororespirans DSM 11544]